MLVRREITAFADNDWPAHEAEFLKEGFFGINAKPGNHRDNWRATFPDLDSYGQCWREFAATCRGGMDSDALKVSRINATILRDIDINDHFAIAHKTFDGRVDLDNARSEHLTWQTIYFCRKKAGRWWIAAVSGFPPSPGVITPSGARTHDRVKFSPPSEQHVTSGPYSPVLEITPGKIVVICGQVPVDIQGEVTSKKFDQQTHDTMANCLKQLRAAGCSFTDVFKVSVYLTDLENWSSFNIIYREYMPEPRPVRTVVQAGLLGDFQVEIEMWAVRA